ncbi:MAG: hypothetical protein Q8J97_02255 [Flavobacteriaceae bacterium]|nr:hypothetical protein [Flavobacteriaceae bacterium]
MKNIILLFQWLYNRRKTKTFTIPEGGTAIILTDREQYNILVNGLSDADTWTNGHYSEVLTNPQTQILTN